MKIHKSIIRVIQMIVAENVVLHWYIFIKFNQGQLQNKKSCQGSLDDL